MKKFQIGILSIALMLLAGCSNGFNLSKVKDTSKPIVKVNNGFITQKMYDKELDRAYNSSELAARNINLSDPRNKPLNLVFKGRVINELIIKSLIQQEADKRKIIATKDDMNKAFSNLEKRIGGKDKLDATLTLNNLSKDDLLEGMKLDVITNKLVDNLTLGSNISDQKALDFYNKNKATKFTNPDLVRAEHILISASEENIRAKIKADNSYLTGAQVNKKVQAEMNAAKNKAEKILAEVKANPAKFEEIAKSNSDDSSSAVRGGDLGYFSRQQMVPEFTKASFTLQPGQISDLVKTNFGYHIIRVVDHKKAGIVPFIEIKNEIQKFLRNQERITVLQNLLVNLKNTAQITYLDKNYDLNAIQSEMKAITKKIPKGQSPLQSMVGGMSK
jgi:peptidyl-prolyl cis-trans isomerase C